MVSRRSPAIATSGCRFLPISAGSMSACTIRARGAKSASLPVTRSSNRAPRATIRSASCRAATAGYVPCMPGMPSASGWVSGNAPRAISVVVTGAWLSSASRSRSACESDLITPPPTYSTGRLACSSKAMAARIAAVARRAWHLIAGQVHGRRPLPVADPPGPGRLLHVLGHVHEDRTRPTGRGDVEGLGDRRRDPLDVGDQLVVLGDRQRDAGDVGFLERVGADQARADLAGNGDHRHGVHVRVRQRGDQVGRPRPAGSHAHAWPSRRPGIALGCVPGALLVPDEDVPQRRRQQRVVGRQDRATGQPEYHFDALHARDCGRVPGLR